MFSRFLLVCLCLGGLWLAPALIAAGPNGIAPTMGACANFTLFAYGGVAGAGSIPAGSVFGDIGGGYSGADGAMAGYDQSKEAPGYSIFVAGNQAGIQPNQGCRDLTTDATTIYSSLTSQVCQTISSVLDGLTLAPGVYCGGAPTTTTFSLNSGTLTLAGYGAGNTTGVWVFIAGSTGTSVLTATNTQIVMTNGGLATNVFWAAGGTVTITGSSTFVGTILSNAATTIGTSTVFYGRAFSHTAGITTAGTDAVALPSYYPYPTVSSSSGASSGSVSASSTGGVPSSSGGALSASGGGLLSSSSSSGNTTVAAAAGSSGIYVGVLPLASFLGILFGCLIFLFLVFLLARSRHTQDPMYTYLNPLPMT